MKFSILCSTLCLSFVFAATPRAEAQSLSDVLADLAPRDRRELLDSGSIEQYIENHRQIAFVPDHPLAERISDTVGRVRPNVISEQIVLVPRRVGPDELLILFNSLRRISNLSYLQYRNERKDTTSDLFHDSYAVKDGDSRERIDDPVVAEIPSRDEIHVLQGLPPFGTVLSSYTYVSEGSAFLFSGTNQDTMTYRGVPVVQSGNMITTILVIAGEDYLLMYGIGAVRAFKMFGLLDDRIEAAFSGRTEGLFNWYRDTYLEGL
jgi:hypothetical protein